MPLFCHRQQVGPVGVLSRTPARTQKQGVHGNPEYNYSSSYVAAQHTYTTIPMTPPPPYDVNYNGHLQPFLPFTGTPQSVLSEPFLQDSNAAHSTFDQLRPGTSTVCAQDQPWQSAARLVPYPAAFHNQVGCPIARGMTQGAALCDVLASRLNDVLRRSGGTDIREDEIEAWARNLSLEVLVDFAEPRTQTKSTRSKDAEEQVKSGSRRVHYKKSWLYKNSRLLPGMFPFKAYLSTWTLVCRAAQSSIDVYDRPRRDQREYYTDADPKHGTKATIIKSQPVDDRNLVIVAVRGSRLNVVDWGVNIHSGPTVPAGFLDDQGNACHTGFLQVARSMIAPVAARLRNLIQQDNTCCGSSLLFTGHSAGGAVASLLYAHMLSSTASSDLADLAGIFKRIHCVTFGTPPVSLLPLQKPSHRGDPKYVFLSFVNEGDPFVRLDSMSYLISWVKLLAAPAPSTPIHHGRREKVCRPKLCSNGPPIERSHAPPRWPVPDATLSVGGRVVLLREKPSRSGNRTIEPVRASDEELRGVIFGDYTKHSMALYKTRVDDLAFAAISGKDAG